MTNKDNLSNNNSYPVDKVDKGKKRYLVRKAEEQEAEKQIEEYLEEGELGENSPYVRRAT